MSQFAGRVDAFLDEFFRMYPVSATATGMHEVDGEWPDLSEAGRAARLAFAGRWEAELRAMPDGALSADERIDRDLLLSELAELLFDETDPRAWRAYRPFSRRHERSWAACRGGRRRGCIPRSPSSSSRGSRPLPATRLLRRRLRRIGQA
jgi:hypothetical protein